MLPFISRMNMRMHLTDFKIKCSSILILLTIHSIVMIIIFNNVFTPKTASYSLNDGKGLSDFDPIKAPLIFVGGHGSSGTTITRFLLDAHPNIRCGGESIVNTVVLNAFKEDYVNKHHLSSVGVTQNVLDNAIREFIYSIIRNTGPPAPRLCDKRSGQYEYMLYLAKLFPEAQFVLMIRDARGAVSSNIKRRIILKEMSHSEALKRWEEMNKRYLQYCDEIGTKKCYKLLYERLVLFPEIELRKLLNFLHVPWDPIVLRHHEIIRNITHYEAQDQSNVASRNKLHVNSLYKWMQDPNMTPDLVQKDAMQIGLMKTFGYAQLGYPPNYEKLLPLS